MDKKVYSTSEVAERLGRKATTISKWCREGRIPEARKIGDDWSIPESSINKLETGKEVVATPETAPTLQNVVDADPEVIEAEKEKKIAEAKAARMACELKYPDAKAFLEAQKKLSDDIKQYEKDRENLDETIKLQSAEANSRAEDEYKKWKEKRDKMEPVFREFETKLKTALAEKKRLRTLLGIKKEEEDKQLNDISRLKANFIEATNVLVRCVNTLNHVVNPNARGWCRYLRYHVNNMRNVYSSDLDEYSAQALSSFKKCNEFIIKLAEAYQDYYQDETIEKYLPNVSGELERLLGIGKKYYNKVPKKDAEGNPIPGEWEWEEDTTKYVPESPITFPSSNHGGLERFFKFK